MNGIVSDFSVAWLDLRESADAKARNSEVANALSARFALRDDVRVVDLGSGTGANLRAVAPLLPDRQSWTLVDQDPALPEAARAQLRSWADDAETDDGGLVLMKGGREIAVSFVTADLALGFDSHLQNAPALVTTSAFLDLLSESALRALAKAVVASGAAFHAALTYNGLQRWTPHRPADSQMAAAFQRHQMRDKGFGPAAGPLAAPFLADQFRLSGYLVLEGDSPWQLKASDRMLIGELVQGHAKAVQETGSVDERVIAAWVGVSRTAAFVGHTDMLAVPA